MAFELGELCNEASFLAAGIGMAPETRMISSPPFSSPPNAVFIVGFMGCGKSTVGQLLANRLAWRFVDLDEQIERSEGRTIAEIFSQAGEGPFRQKEQEALRRIFEQTSQGGGWVVALGGGTFAQPANRELLQRAGALTVWIECPVEDLLLRCALVTNRPLFRDEASFRELYLQRLPFYQQAVFTVHSGGEEPGVVVNQILELKPFRGIACCN